jgi:hypothetical protein
MIAAKINAEQQLIKLITQNEKLNPPSAILSVMTTLTFDREEGNTPSFTKYK